MIAAAAAATARGTSSSSSFSVLTAEVARASIRAPASVKITAAMSLHHHRRVARSIIIHRSMSSSSSNMMHYARHLISTPSSTAPETILPPADTPNSATNELQNRHAYNALHKWSTTHLNEFWSSIAQFCRVPHLQTCPALDSKPDGMFPPPQWFMGAKDMVFNPARVLLEPDGGLDEDIAMVFHSEGMGKRYELTRGQLKRAVVQTLSRLPPPSSDGVEVGNIPMGLKKSAHGAILPNTPHSTLAMLCALTQGHAYASTSPDFGYKAIMDRLGQVQPSVLWVCGQYRYRGKLRDVKKTVGKVVENLVSKGSLKCVMVVGDGFTTGGDRIDGGGEEGSAQTAEYLRKVLGDDSNVKVLDVENDIRPFAPGEKDEVDLDAGVEVPYISTDFNDPIYVMFSSGTTGPPKCIVQHSGVILNHLKELILHTNLGGESNPDSKLMYYTTTGWMMWNWSQSVLGVRNGGPLVMYDGDPMIPSYGTLWEIAAREKLHTFGTSARYLSAMATSDYVPLSNAPSTSHLKQILTTGSPAGSSVYEWVRSNVGNNVDVRSICGGTDLNGCFLLGHPDLIVEDGTLTCAGLGMDVRILSDDGNNADDDDNIDDVECQDGEVGELSCISPFPSAPSTFLGPNGTDKYRQSYFESSPNGTVWRHGDAALRNPRTGSYVVKGRSDATLNPGGVRLGTSDFYALAVESGRFKEMGLADAVVVGQPYKLGDGTDDVRIVMFLQLDSSDEGRSDAGDSSSDDDSSGGGGKDEHYRASIAPKPLRDAIRSALRSECSPRHVPAAILVCPKIPITASGKRVEIAVRDALVGKPAKNRGALADPNAMDWFEREAKDLVELAIERGDA